MHDRLLARAHSSQAVEEVSGPHNLRVHDDLVDQVVGLCDQLRWLSCGLELVWQVRGAAAQSCVLRLRLGRAHLPSHRSLLVQQRILVEVCQKKRELIFDPKILFYFDLLFSQARVGLSKLLVLSFDRLRGLNKSLEQLVCSIRSRVVAQGLDDLH